MTPHDFGATLAARLLEKQSEGEVHPLQSPAAGYRDELFRQRQQQQQEQMAQQAQMAQQQAANLPQGPTATNYPNIAPTQGLEPHDLPGSQPLPQQQAGQPKTAGVTSAVGARARDLYQRATTTAGDLATTYTLDGPVPAAAKSVSMAGGKVNEIIKTILSKARQLPSPSKSVAGQIARKALSEKEAGLAGLMSTAGTLGRGALNFGKGMYAATKPLTGLATGGFRGMGKGLQTAGKLMYTGGKFSPAAAAGAGVAAYGMYNSLQNPIQQTGDGVRLRSPIKIPNVRLRSPMVADGGGVNVQNPFKVLW